MTKNFSLLTHTHIRTCVLPPPRALHKFTDLFHPTSSAGPKVLKLLRQLFQQSQQTNHETTSPYLTPLEQEDGQRKSGIKKIYQEESISTSPIGWHIHPKRTCLHNISTVLRKLSHTCFVSDMRKTKVAFFLLHANQFRKSYQSFNVSFRCDKITFFLSIYVFAAFIEKLSEILSRTISHSWTISLRKTSVPFNHKHLHVCISMRHDLPERGTCHY